MHVIATAGHVDHGKSTLIRALTGMEPDRWAEERRRGMTIDLGYAWTELPDGTQIAFVDVPGHQRFIANMLAGVGPVPAVLLVVAADEGWGRQTAEHLSALNALGVRHGILAVTRSDLGDAELATQEAREYLAGTPLEDIEAVAVSPVAGTGLDSLRSALSRMTSELRYPDSPATRLWVDRVFTIRGAGTVVTGTLTGGSIAVGDEMVVSSSGEPVRVRSLESLKKAVNSVSAVARVAVNLRGIKLTEIRRGDALVTAGLWAPVATVDVRLVNTIERLPSTPILHVGSAAVSVRVRPMSRDLARLTLESSLPLHVGERAILRDPGRQRVVAGVVILDTNPPLLRRRGASARRVQELATVTGEPDPGADIRRRRAVRRSQLVAAGVLDPGATTPSGVVVVSDWLIDHVQWTDWQEEIGIAVDSWAATHPLSPAMPGAAVVQRLALPDAAILEPLVRETSGLTVDRDGVHRRDAVAELPAEVDAAIRQLLQKLDENPFAAPQAPELAAIGLTERYLAVATRNGTLLRIAPGVYLHPDAPEEAVRRLAALPQPFTMSEARQTLDTTRRVALPLLELLDRRMRTVRVDSELRTVRM